MLNIILCFVRALLASVKSRRELAVENLVLRQQLAVLKRSVKRPTITATDRAFWALVLRWWPRWREAPVTTAPDGREIEPTNNGTVIVLPKVGGLHHRYVRKAA